MGIYGIFCSESGDCLYVGLSRNIEDRWKSHLKTLKNGTHPRKEFVSWFAHKGMSPETLRFEILEEGCSVDLNTLEIKWFKELSPRFFGKVPSENEKWSHSDETKEKIKNSHIAIAVNNGVRYSSKTCPCGVVFTGREKSLLKYCSSDCSKLYRKPRVPRIKSDVFCKQCGNLITSHGVEYCSRNCHSISSTILLESEVLRSMYWDKNMSLQDIGSALNVSRQTIFNRLKKFGIPRRPNNP